MPPSALAAATSLHNSGKFPSTALPTQQGLSPASGHQPSPFVCLRQSGPSMNNVLPFTIIISIRTINHQFLRYQLAGLSTCNSLNLSRRMPFTTAFRSQRLRSKCDVRPKSEMHAFRPIGSICLPIVPRDNFGYTYASWQPGNPPSPSRRSALLIQTTAQSAGHHRFPAARLRSTAANADCHYKTLYVNDGQDTPAIQMAGTLAALIAHHEIEPSSSSRSTPRAIDCTSTGRRGFPTRAGSAGRHAVSSSFSMKCCRTLIVAIARCRPGQHRDDGLLAGAASMAFDLAWTHPDVFGAVACSLVRLVAHRRRRYSTRGRSRASCIAACATRSRPAMSAPVVSGGHQRREGRSAGIATASSMRFRIPPN